MECCHLPPYRGWSCTDPVGDHALITWLIMHCSRAWSCTDHVNLFNPPLIYKETHQKSQTSTEHDTTVLYLTKTMLNSPPESNSKCVLSCFSRAQLFANLWTVARQALLSLEFSRQEDWSGLPFPPLGDLLRNQILLLYVSWVSRWVLYHWEAPIQNTYS